VLAASIAAVTVFATRGGAPSPVAPTAAGRATPAGDPVRDAIARATELADKGDREAALDVLRRARKQSPDSGPLAYTAGRICFSKYYWTEGLKHFRDAIRIDPAYRSDPELIKTVLRGFITTPGYNEDLASFLRDEIGAAAQPLLEETARDHPNAMIRGRAAAELHRYPGK
jgi:tetratricopeptide (TPR) repeat protein